MVCGRYLSDCLFVAYPAATQSFCLYGLDEIVRQFGSDCNFFCGDCGCSLVIRLCHVQTLSCHSLSCVRHLPLSSGSRSVLDNLQCGLRPTLLRIDNRIYRTETHLRHCVWHHHLHGTEKPPQTHSFEKVTKLTRKVTKLRTLL